MTTSHMHSHVPFDWIDLEICRRGQVADVINPGNFFLKIGLSVWKTGHVAEEGVVTTADDLGDGQETIVVAEISPFRMN